jgi:hypothetical protein
LVASFARRRLFALARGGIKDLDLAREVALIEENEALDASESRARVKEAIDRGYTAAI